MKVDDHSKMQIEKDRSNSGKRPMEQLNQLVNQMNLHLLYALAIFKPKVARKAQRAL